ncbi:sulfite exporter TauE/SafE family protein [Xenorhabdus sp. 42]|uniref:sulfite exporter TauE/SafE family protein n=1 Tax=Xenorhabdus szentirmaii TaxID=290112 RepID=UPI000C0398CF|nr:MULTISPECIES: sulfite exporter TauE/SafE family protein [Xenorhabdus]MBD2821208.1 sulfite exporter TauE/SafE family protein [Xenorhabdus sp. 42]PHM42627.1 membrane protein [Xenorhabdus szentirmaii]
MPLIPEIVTGAFVGLIISTTGVGGGVIVLPILTYFFGLDALSAVATANLLSMLMKISSSYMHFRIGNIPLFQSVVILLIMLPGTVLASYGVTILSHLSHYQMQLEWGINLLVVFAILFSLYLFYHQIRQTPKPDSHGGLQSGWVKSLLLPATGAGLVLGATGVGGGVVVLPLLLRYTQMNIKQAIGVSLFVTMILSGSSAFAYAYGDHTHWKLAVMLFMGSLLAIPFAKYLMKCLPDNVFQYATFSLILCSAVLMGIRLIE